MVDKGVKLSSKETESRIWKCTKYTQQKYSMLQHATLSM